MDNFTSYIVLGILALIIVTIFIAYGCYVLNDEYHIAEKWRRFFRWCGKKLNIFRRSSQEDRMSVVNQEEQDNDDDGGEEKDWRSKHPKVMACRYDDEIAGPSTSEIAGPSSSSIFEPGTSSDRGRVCSCKCGGVQHSITEVDIAKVIEAASNPDGILTEHEYNTYMSHVEAAGNFDAKRASRNKSKKGKQLMKKKFYDQIVEVHEESV